MALYEASQAGDIAQMARLLDGGADPSAFVPTERKDGKIFRNTALVEAAGRGHLEAVRLLLARGADPSLAASVGTTPLMSAAVNGHAAVVWVLAACGAALDAANPETGCTAFHHACFYNQPECAAALIELGCDTASKDLDGRTGMQWAEGKGHAVVLERLQEAMAGAQREEVGRLIARQAFGTAAPLLARMLRDAPADPELLAWEAEVAAVQAEAEAAAEANAAALLAELEAEGSGVGSAGGQSKSQKKKEKQRKKKAAAAAAAAATADGVPEPGLEPELQMPATVAAASGARAPMAKALCKAGPAGDLEGEIHRVDPKFAS
jgi:ankyrin repeat protein